MGSGASTSYSDLSWFNGPTHKICPQCRGSKYVHNSNYKLDQPHYKRYSICSYCAGYGNVRQHS